MNSSYPPAYFLDIDGVLIDHCGNMQDQLLGKKGQSSYLKVFEFFEEAYKADAKIILCTGRKESERNNVVSLMKTLGIQYDTLIMGMPRGPRIVINDRKPDGTPTAFAILTDRNSFDWVEKVKEL